MYTRIDWYWTPTSGVQRLPVAASVCRYAGPAPWGRWVMPLVGAALLLQGSATWGRILVGRLTGWW